jgi:hypothetical protein
MNGLGCSMEDTSCHPMRMDDTPASGSRNGPAHDPDLFLVGAATDRGGAWRPLSENAEDGGESTKICWPSRTSLVDNRIGMDVVGDGESDTPAPTEEREEASDARIASTSGFKPGA